LSVNQPDILRKEQEEEEKKQQLRESQLQRESERRKAHQKEQERLLLINKGCSTDLIGRGVERLVHITYQKHLPSILKEGLQPGREGYDPLRLDNLHRPLCFSIQLPNISMFYRRCRQMSSREVAGDVGDHVAILVSPNLAERPDSYFSTTNAASRHSQQGRGRSALEKLFDERVRVKGGYVSRAPCNGLATFPSWMTTSQQAEILFKHPIAVSEISQVCFPNDAAIQRFQHIWRESGRDSASVELIVNQKLFPFEDSICTYQNYRQRAWAYIDSRRLIPDTEEAFDGEEMVEISDKDYAAYLRERDG
jgi:hypothetical protein